MDCSDRDHTPRAPKCFEQYIDLRVAFVDAAVLAIVERLNEPTPATLDRRHFWIMRVEVVGDLREQGRDVVASWLSSPARSA